MLQRKHSPELKMKVALEAVRGQMTTSEIASRFQVHPYQVSRWKKQALEALPAVFGSENGHDQTRTAREQEQLTDQLYQEIGRLKIELDWLQKKGAMYHSNRSQYSSSCLLRF